MDWNIAKVAKAAVKADEMEVSERMEALATTAGAAPVRAEAGSDAAGSETATTPLTSPQADSGAQQFRELVQMPSIAAMSDDARLASLL